MNTTTEEIFYTGRHPVLANVLEFIGAAITMALMVLLMWLYLIVTPDQCSAECDLAREQMEQAISR